MTTMGKRILLLLHLLLLLFFVYFFFIIIFFFFFTFFFSFSSSSSSSSSPSSSPFLLLHLLLYHLLLLLFFFFFVHWHYSPLWTLACRTISFHFFLSATNSFHLSLLALEDLLLLPLSIFSWVFPFFSSLPVLEWRSFWTSYPPPLSLGDLTSLPFAILSTLLFFSPVLISSSSRFVRLFHSPFSCLLPYILLNIFLSKINRACSSFFVNVHASAPHDTTGLGKCIQRGLYSE